jgi:3-oxoacyl-[acyl-carrier protein] reductase
MSQSIAIVGGSGGLGSAICGRLGSPENSLLIGFHRNEEAALEIIETVTARGGQAMAKAVDLRDPDSVERFLDSAPGRLTAVVNAIGPAIPLRPLVEVSAQEFRDIMDIDVNGAFNLLTASARRFTAAGRGTIVQLLTAAVLRTLEDDGMSGIPKTAIEAIVRQLAREVGPAGVRINAVAPGVIDAGIVHSSFTADSVAQAVIERCLERTPLPRLGQPGEVAELVAFLLNDAAAYINGQIIGIDGGYSA